MISALLTAVIPALLLPWVLIPLRLPPLFALLPMLPLAWVYAATLGLALVYLGEHYVVDLAAGLALAEGVRRGTPAAEPLARGVSSAVRYLERRARA